MAPALFTQLELQLDPLAGGSASADEAPKTSMASKTDRPTRVERRVVAATIEETAQIDRLISFLPRLQAIIMQAIVMSVA